MASRIRLRRDTAANWTSINPTLALGEPGVETDTGLMKIGDGTSAWTGLDYTAATGPTGLTGATGATGQFADADDLITVSTTELTIGTGPQTLIIESGKKFSPGMVVIIAQTSNAAVNYMSGIVTSLSGTTLVVEVNRTVGSGTINDWTITFASGVGGGGAEGVLNVSDYGAVGDGVADDTLAWRAAIAACPEGGTVVGNPEHTYYLTYQDADDLVLYIDKGITIDLNGAAVTYKPWKTGDAAASHAPCFWFQGVKGTAHAIEAAENRERVLTCSTIADAANYSAGDWVWITTDAKKPQWNYPNGNGMGWSTPGYFGYAVEPQQIESVNESTGEITLTRILDNYYPDNATIQKLTLLNAPRLLNVRYAVEEDADAVSTKVLQNYDTGGHFVAMEYTRDAIVQGVYVENFRMFCLWSRGNVNITARNISGIKTDNGKYINNGGHAYVIRHYGCSGSLTVGCRSFNTRHLLDYTASYDGISIGNISHYGGNNYSVHSYGCRRITSIDDTAFGGLGGYGWYFGNESFNAVNDGKIIRFKFVGNKGIQVAYNATTVNIVDPDITIVGDSGIGIRCGDGGNYVTVSGGKIDTSLATNSYSLSTNGNMYVDEKTLFITPTGADPDIEYSETDTTNPLAMRSLHVVREWPTASLTNIALNLDSYGDTNRFVFRRANGTKAIPTKTITGDVLGAFGARSFDGNSFNDFSNGTINISAAQDGNAGAGANMLLGVTPNGGSSTSQRIVLNQDGLVQIYTYAGATPTNPNNARLYVEGAIESTSGGFIFPDDTVQTTAATPFSLPYVNKDSANPTLEVRKNNYIAGSSTGTISLPSSPTSGDVIAITNNGGGNKTITRGSTHTILGEGNWNNTTWVVPDNTCVIMSFIGTPYNYWCVLGTSKVASGAMSQADILAALDDESASALTLRAATDTDDKIIVQDTDGNTQFYIKGNGEIGFYDDTNTQVGKWISTNTNPKLLIGATSALNSSTYKFEVQAPNTGTIRGFNTGASGSSGGSFIINGHDDSAAMGSGDRLGGYTFAGAEDASHTITNGVVFAGYTTEAWSSSANGAYGQIEVCPTGSDGSTSTNRVVAARFTGTGTVHRCPTAYITADIDSTNGLDYINTNPSANLPTYYMIVCNYTGNLTLPAPAAAHVGKEYVFKSVHASGTTLTTVGGGNNFYTTSSTAAASVALSTTNVYKFICAQTGSSTYQWLQIT